MKSLNTLIAVDSSKEEFYTIVQNAPDIIGVHHAGEVVFINRKGVELLKAKSEADLVGKPMMQFVHVDYTEVVKSRAHKVEINRNVTSALEEKFNCLDGTVIDVEVKAIPIKFEGKDSVLIIARDISERIKAEEKIKAERLLLRTVIDNIPDSIYVKDIKGRKIIANPQELIYMGVKSEEEAIGKTDHEIYAKKSADEYLENDAIVYQTGKPVLNTVELINRTNQQPHWLLTSKVPLRNEKNEVIGLVGIGRDITERVELLDKLRENEQRLAKISQSSSDCIWEYNKEGKIIYCSDSIEKIFGYTVNEVMGISVLDLLEGEEKERVTKHFMSVLKEQKAIIDFEYSFKHKEGNTVFVLTNAYPNFDKDGYFKGYIGVDKDITHRKQEERRLKLLETVILNTSDGVVITDAKSVDSCGLKIIYANEAYLKMAGYAREEIIGKTPRILQGVNTDRNELNKLKQAVEDGKSCEVEIINYKKNGEEFWTSVSISPVFDLKGQPEYWVGIKRDITKKVKQELELKKAIITAQENEKFFIGRELHDNIAQILVGSLLTLSLVKASSEKETEWLKQSIESIHSSIEEIRNLSHHLAPITFKGNNFISSIEDLIKVINKGKKFNVITHYDDLTNAELSSELQLNLYRIIQEQVQNIIKHANATAIEISIRLFSNLLRLRIYDNGKGFNTKLTTSGIGLRNIKNRTEMFQGFCIINSSEGKGCEILIKIPLS